MSTPGADPGTGPRMANALTIDVEDYFQVSAFDAPGKRATWEFFERRVCTNTYRLLDRLAEASVTGTFFVLGWVAERHPYLVKRIAAAGHEVASHGYFHRLVYHMTPDEFRADLRRAARVIGDACGIGVRAFRAPSFSITQKSLWAIDVLIEEGYTVDSSIYPVFRDRYGIPGAPRHAYTLVTPSGQLLELPPSTVKWGGMTLPVAGGGYFRLYPYSMTQRAIRDINERDGQPAVVYLHPWELDPGQPRQAGSLLSRFRHYVNLDKTEPRLARLLGDFRFGTVSDVLAQAASGVDLRVAGLRTGPEARAIHPSAVQVRP